MSSFSSHLFRLWPTLAMESPRSFVSAKLAIILQTGKHLSEKEAKTIIFFQNVVVTEGETE
jgi:hypothetical protein